ncbi:MAG: hypothetical protein ACHQM6_07635 [Candidatus Kapaibacterium sp.]
MNTELLQFMDGTLAPEQEAELLHRLSVSPERREILRSFFNMKVLFERDRNSIAVPYAAEQKLWASLGQMMPPMVQTGAAPTAAVLETAATTATRTGFFNRTFTAASVAVLCLLIGLGSGYFAGKSSNTENVITVNPAGLNPVERTLSPSGSQSAIAPSTTTTLRNSIAKHTTSFHAAHHTSDIISGAPLDETIVNPNTSNADIAFTNSAAATVDEQVADPALSQISSVTPKQIAGPNIDVAHVHDPSQFSLRSPFDIGELDVQPQKNFIQKFEFYFNEGIGKQFPNNAATNVSMPVVTNSSISALFQAFANTPGILSHFWAGGSFGTANVTQKKLRLDLDPIQKNYVMVGDLVHVQTTWYGGMLQYRVPLSRVIALTFAGSIGNSSVGSILGGEIGAHVDASNEVGFVVGFRGTHFSYSVDQQQQALLNQGVALGLSVPANVTGNQLSYNFEISSGIYLHF